MTRSMSCSIRITATPLAAIAFKSVAEFFGVNGVKTCCWLVQQQNRRFGRKRAGDFNEPPLAMRKRARRLIWIAVEANEREQRKRRRLVCFRRFRRDKRGHA